MSPVSSSHTAATLLHAAGVRHDQRALTLTFNNQLGAHGRVTAAVNGLAVRDRTAAFDAHFAQLVPGALLPVPSYTAGSPPGSMTATGPRVVAV